MFDEIQFDKIDKLPKYIFAEINELKMKARKEGKDILDFSMGNPDSPTPKIIVDKLIESSLNKKTHRYSPSKGIYALRLAMSKWYQRKYDVDLDPDSEIIATIGSKEGYVHLVKAITNIGDVAIVPEPTYPIHSQAFKFVGGIVKIIEMKFNKDNYALDEDKFLYDVRYILDNYSPKPKFLVVNFPHNPTTVTVTLDFYKKLVELAKEKRFYIISDIAYADITFDGYKTPSIMQVEGAKEVAVESYTLSKSYNMAGWRVGLISGNKKLIKALTLIKSWLDYGMFIPIQVAATFALDNCFDLPEKEIIPMYKKRRNVLIKSFKNSGWEIESPNATMFVWAKLPKIVGDIGSLEFSKQLLLQANIVVSPGIGFGKLGDNYVRIALIENEQRIKQAARNIKKYLQSIKIN